MPASTPRPIYYPVIVVLFAVGLIGLLWGFFLARYIVLVSLIGIGLGTLISPLLEHFQNRFKIPRALSAVIFMVFFFLGLGGVGLAIVTLVSGQFLNLSSKAPAIARELQNRFLGWFQHYPWVENQIRSFDVAQAFQTTMQKILLGLEMGLTGITGLLLALILAIYTSIDAHEYFDALIRAFPPRKRRKAEEVFKECASVLRTWFKAQLLDMLILGGVTAIGLLIVGVDYWAVYGLLMGLFGIIPYVGPFSVTIFSVLVTLASNPSQVPWVVLVSIVAHLIEGNIVLPLVMRGKVGLSEMPLLVFMLLLGDWLGVIGIFLAPPLFAVLRTLYIKLYLPKIEGVSLTPDS